MIVGVPREIKRDEARVGATPAWVHSLVEAGHRVLVETGAGLGSGYPDDAFREAGADLVADHGAVFAGAELVLKVKEPIASEYDLLHPGLALFCFLHLAAQPALAAALLEHRVAAIAYETVQAPDGTLPLLAPMSEVAGRMAVQAGAHYLERPHGGKGKLLGGVPGVLPCEVVVIGGGTVGTNAAQIALGMGAHVTILDTNVDRLRFLSEILGGNRSTLMSNLANVGDSVGKADLLVGAVLVPGARAPRLVSAAMVDSMAPGSVVVDVAIDQGGCIETSRPTTHSDPVFRVGEVVHYCVTNMPGAVPHTSTQALCNVTMPYALKLASQGIERVAATDSRLARGVNCFAGRVTHQAVAEALNETFTPLDDLLAAPAHGRL